MSFKIEYLDRLEGDLRAAAARQTSRSGRRISLAPRALIVAAALLLMGGSLALAFGGRVLTALADKPAPKHVKKEFRQMITPPLPLDGAPPYPKGYLPGKIVPGSERRVYAVRNSRGKVAALYAARTASGRVCAISSGWPFGGGGCSGGPARTPFSVLITGSTVRGPGPGGRGYVRSVVGRASSPGAAAVRVVYADGRHDDVALSDRWFMFEVPFGHAKLAAAPVRLDVLAADGTRLASANDPWSVYRKPPHFSKPLPASVKLLASAELPNDGGTLRIWSGRDAQGHDCFRHLRDGHTQMFPAWTCTPMVGHYGYPVYPLTQKQSQVHTAVQWQMGLRNDPHKTVGFGYAYATGWVAPQVAQLTLRFQDGTAADVPLHDRYYLYVVPPANWPAGHRPSILEARNAQGALVYHAFLYPRQHCIYPGADPLCRNQAMGTG